MKTKLIYFVAGIIIGFLLTFKFCTREVQGEERIVEEKVYVRDTIVKPVTITTTVKVPVYKSKTDTVATIEYRDSLVTITDYFPVLDSACLAQLDSIKRVVIHNRTDTIFKEKETIKTIKETTYTETKYSRVYAGLGAFYNPDAREFNYSYNVDYQFKNKLTVGVAAYVPFKTNTFQRERFSVNVKVPLFKFK